MFFVVGKIVGWLLTPSNFFILLVGLCALLSVLSRRARYVGVLMVVLLLGASFLPVGAWLLVPLEDRFLHMPTLPAEIAGIIVLGGAVQPELSAVRDEAATKQYAERLAAGLMLARRFPDAVLVYSGGSASLDGTGLPETKAAERWYREAGLPAGRLRLEDRSRTTYENAVFTKELLQPGADQVWVLVTSAFHMPRSMGSFREAGWQVIPWPVDYQTDGHPAVELLPTASDNLTLLDLAAHEWMGLIAYRLSGRSTGFFPGPEPRP